MRSLFTLPKPLFITFEGIDGCGKSTQLQLLSQRLRSHGIPVLEIAEPGGSAVSSRIRELLLDARVQGLRPIPEVLLYFAARAQNVEEIILPALTSGTVVLCDRFTDSTLAYQGAARSLGDRLVLALHAVACGDLFPDLTLFLDIPPSCARQRIAGRSGVHDNVAMGLDRIEREPSGFHLAVRDAYLDLAKASPFRIVAIDATGTVPEVAERVWDAVQRFVGARRRPGGPEASDSVEVAALFAGR